MHRTSSATVRLVVFTFTVRSFHFLFTRKPTPAWLLFALEWWPLCKVVKHSSRLLSSPMPITPAKKFHEISIELYRCFVKKTVS